MDNTGISRRQLVIKFAMGSIVLFLLLTLIAMFTYPGGTKTHPETEGYTFFYNYFSDLGLYRTFSGEPKWASMILFSSGLGLGGITFVAFFLVIPKWFRDDAQTLLFARIGSAGGVICAIGLFVVACTPADLLLDPHVWAVKIAMLGFLVACIFYSIAVFRRKDYPNKYVVIYAIFMVILVYYLWLLFFGPSTDPETSGIKAANIALMQHCASQKVLVYSMSLTILVQSWGLLRIPEKSTTPPS